MYYSEMETKESNNSTKTIEDDIYFTSFSVIFVVKNTFSFVEENVRTMNLNVVLFYKREKIKFCLGKNVF